MQDSVKHQYIAVAENVGANLTENWLQLKISSSASVGIGQSADLYSEERQL
jgi:hypothetical protein